MIKTPCDGGLLTRLNNRLPVPPKDTRMISFVIDVAFIGLLIWDSIAHGGAVSGSQLAFGIIKMDCLKEGGHCDCRGLVPDLSQRCRLYP